MASQSGLFEDDVPAPLSPPDPPTSTRKTASAVAACEPPPQATSAVRRLRELAPQNAHLLGIGTSSWSFAGWNGLVFGGDYAEAALSKHGLQAYGKHPWLRTVSLDRSFYRALNAAQYQAYADQVPPDFRFVVKAPASVCDATVRDESGRGLQANPVFLNPDLAWCEALQPAASGLGEKLGALVFQISPLPSARLRDMPQVLAELENMLAHLQSQPRWRDLAPNAMLAVEVRDQAWLNQSFADVLKRTGTRYCLGSHAKMPSIADQLPMLRATWPGPLICRWNLHAKHGKFGYQDAKDVYAPFDQLVDEDPDTRATLAKVVAATIQAGHPALITINNKAEGSAPRSVIKLYEAVAQAIENMSAT
jgi:uncharacterized protein YecE (DUF72 family)